MADGRRYQKAQEGMPAGVNAVAAFNVDNVEETKERLSKEGVTFVGEMVEIPGHVRMQLCADPDGNQYHICENLES